MILGAEGAYSEWDEAIRVDDIVKIAVVDDDEGMRSALEGLIRSLGHEPLGFGSAEAFLHCAARRDVACVILDVRMPGMNGLVLQELLRRENPSPPIIFMTSYGDDHMRRRALAAGARCFLGKPVDDAELIDCIQASLARPQGSS